MYIPEILELFFIIIFNHKAYGGAKKLSLCMLGDSSLQKYVVHYKLCTNLLV
jgi:hypothetical protein